ncbi:GNAT family N-acetyltransferase [Thalassotalea sp. PS06]|uniref:GNAT family N-acetyltransferase n=1 Tax=Thalassotalea sp. PS06 TaxID=2594005 RepID=UPI001164B8E7|nr:GNAT family N-acetyltransferase [Thalassotalea sp. PS06]QDP01874.1 GNAT family N-acetyltransferase [Thalassotalea sp. PS06]
MNLSARFFTSISDIPRDHWQQLFKNHSLFIQYQYLLSLEQSQCVSADTGWIANHLIIYDQETPIAGLPLYVKMHSYGEYMFDWNWAAAYQQRQMEYYPKLLSAIPFTPVSGTRLAFAENTKLSRNLIIETLIEVLKQRLDAFDASNFQCLFIDKDSSDELEQYQVVQRNDVLFQWFNQDYKTFDDFLGKLTARKRKSIKKERKVLSQQQLKYQWIENAEITPTHWQLFYQCYRQTYLKRSGHQGYLNLQFFQSLSENLAENCRLLMVSKDGQTIASALFFEHAGTLYGRYWGALAQIPGLHFEVCYYQGIEYCIEHGLQKFDAGVQGEHKLNRGFVPVLSYGNYLLAESPFKAAIEDVIKRENNHYRHLLDSGALDTAYRKED